MSFNKKVLPELPNPKENLYIRPFPDARNLTQYYTRKEDVDSSNAISYKPQSIYSPLGIYKAAELLMFAKPDEFQSSHNDDLIDKIKSVIKILIAGPFVGFELKRELLKFSPFNDIENNFIEELKKDAETAACPEMMLYDTVDGTPYAVYNPKLRMFVPRGGELPNILDIENMLMDVEEVARRYCAYFEIKLMELKNKLYSIQAKLNESNDTMDRDGLESELTDLRNWYANVEYLKENAYDEYRVNKFEFEEYLREPKTPIDSIIEAYLNKVNPNENHGLIFGYLGIMEESQTILVPEILAVTTAFDSNDSSLCKGCDVRKIEDHVYVYPPVNSCIDPESFSMETIGELPNDPEAISVRVTKDSKVYRKVYFKGDEGWHYAQPNTILDCNYMIPSGQLSKYYYIEFKAPNDEWHGHGSAVSDVQYVLYPDGAFVSEMRGMMHTVGKEDRGLSEWSIIERSQRAEYIQLRVKNGVIYTTLRVPTTNVNSSQVNNNLKIALDTGGSVTVVLTDDRTGDGLPHAPLYENICYPLTLCDEKAFINFLNKALGKNESKKDDDKRESNLERYKSRDRVGDIYFSTRIYDVSYSYWMQLLENYRGDFERLPDAKGIYLNIKGRLLSSSEGINIQSNRNELMIYMVDVLRPIIFGAIRNGYCFSEPSEDGNIELLVSYPDNGENDEITRNYLEVIDGAIEYLNQLLSPDHQIKESNFTTYSEGAATTAYHLKNNYKNLGKNTQIIVSDIGATTNDITFRINDYSRCVSIPLAGNEITQRTLTSVIKSNWTIDQISSLFSVRVGEDREREEIKRVVKFAKDSITQFNDGQAVSECVPAWWAVSHLFKDFDFRIGVTNSVLPFQLGTEQRLLCAIPFYAYVMKKAIEEGKLSLDKPIKFMPSGNGSRAFDNTRRNFKDYFIEKLKNFLNDQINDPFKNKIEFLPNSDSKKHGVAEGMIMLKDKNMSDSGMTVNASETNTDNTGDIDYYIHMASFDNEDFDRLKKYYENNSNGDLEKLEATIEIKKKAYERLIDNYTSENFLTHYNHYFQIKLDSIESKTWDRNMRTGFNEATFDNVKQRIKDNYMNLIMSCSGLEAYALTISMINEFTDDLIGQMQSLEMR